MLEFELQLDFERVSEFELHDDGVTLAKALLLGSNVCPR
jgi:hypothetical protein